MMPAPGRQQRHDEDAEVLSDAKLEQLLSEESKPVRAEVVLVPILAGLLGLVNSFRRMRLPEISPSPAVEGATLG